MTPANRDLMSGMRGESAGVSEGCGVLDVMRTASEVSRVWIAWRPAARIVSPDSTGISMSRFTFYKVTHQLDQLGIISYIS